jgi:hypothetical protein
MRKLLRLFSGLLCESSGLGRFGQFFRQSRSAALPEMQTQHIPVLEWRRPTKFGDPIARAAPGFTAARVAVSERGAEKVKTSAPLSPLPPSPQTRKEHRQERVCALWPPWGVTDGIEPGPATAQLIVKASLDGSSDPPDPRRAVCELRQNAMEPSPALAGFFFFGKLARSATPEVATRDRCTQVRPLRYFSPRAP